MDYLNKYFLSSPTLTIPNSSLGYETNNRHKQFPPLMSDGRSIVSNAQSIEVINKKLINENRITTNWKYRQYMIKNANTIMEYNYRESSNDTGYIVPPIKTTTKHSYDNKLIIPYTFDSLNDNSKPFEMTDLKEFYLTKEQMNSKKVIPTLFKY
jgi:hypothetical protein